MTRLDPDKPSVSALEFEAVLKSRVIGQDRAIKKLVQVYDVIEAKLHDPVRPPAVLLFAGPSGSGKTALCQAVAEAFYGNPEALLRIDCAEYQHDHEIARLTGAPAGYLGHRDTVALLSQDAVNKHFTDKHKVSILLFDEIEKASRALWQLLLGIMDYGRLTLGTNTTTTFERAVIVLTSNVGTRETNKALSGGMGFTQSAASEDAVDLKIYTATKHAAERMFPPEFINRIDRMIVFRALTPEHLTQILTLELAKLQKRLLDNGHLLILRVDDRVRKLLIDEGTDAKFGARHLRRAIDRFIGAPLARLIASRQVENGHVIFCSFERGSVVFDAAATGTPKAS